MRGWWNDWLRFRRALTDNTGGPAAAHDFLTLHVLLDVSNGHEHPFYLLVQEDNRRMALGVPSVLT